MGAGQLYDALFSGNRTIVVAVAAIALAIVGVTVFLIVRYKKIMSIRDGSDSTAVVTNVAYYSELALVAALCLAMFVGAMLVHQAPQCSPALFAMVELPVLALASACIALVYRHGRGITTTTTMAVFGVLLLFNVVWITLFQFSGVQDYLLAGAGNTGTHGTADAGIGRFFALFVDGEIDAAKRANAQHVFGAIFVMIVGCIVAVLVIAAAFVKKMPRKQFVAEALTYTFLPLVPEIAVLTALRGVDMPRATMFGAGSSAFRAVVYMMLQFSGLIDKFLGAMNVDLTLTPDCTYM